MITVLTWLWDDPTHGLAVGAGGDGPRLAAGIGVPLAARREFKPHHVGVLAAMLQRHMGVPHRVVCISDEPGDYGPLVSVLPTPPAALALARLPSPEGPRFPSSYRRLWAFSEEAAMLGDRLLVLDIDLIVRRSLAHLFALDDDFVGWRPRMGWGGVDRVAGGMYLLRAGSRADVWTSFGRMGCLVARRAGYRGSDQAWISYKLGAGARIWPEGSGLYSIRDMGNGRLPVPEDACLVQFNGPQKPWDAVKSTQPNLAWARQHWR